MTAVRSRLTRAEGRMGFYGACVVGFDESCVNVSDSFAAALLDLCLQSLLKWWFCGKPKRHCTL